MTNISIERINAKSPYKVEKTDDGDFAFQTSGGVIYGIAFLDDAPIGGCETYQLTISNKNDKHGAFDPNMLIMLIFISKPLRQPLKGKASLLLF